jgi:hypothetical protein
VIPSHSSSTRVSYAGPLRSRVEGNELGKTIYAGGIDYKRMAQMQLTAVYMKVPEDYIAFVE